MTGFSAPVALTLQLALLSAISFGGYPTVLPDLSSFVATHGWMTEQEFANFFALSQAIPGPNMILLTGLVGWRVWGLPGAIVSGVATFGPPSVLYFTCYRLWDRFRDASWQRVVRNGLVPVTTGLVIAGGVVIARAAAEDWPAVVLTIAAAVLFLRTRLNPFWVLVVGGVLGGFGLL